MGESINKDGRYPPHGHGVSIRAGNGSQVQNVTFRNLLILNVEAGPNIKVSGSSTSGFVRNVTFENMVILNSTKEDIYFHTDYPGELGNVPSNTSLMTAALASTSGFEIA